MHAHAVLWVLSGVPMDCRPLDSSVRGILQARILEWVAISFSRGSFQLRNPTQVPCIAGRFFTAEPPAKPKHTQNSAITLRIREPWALLSQPHTQVIHTVKMSVHSYTYKRKQMFFQSNQPYFLNILLKFFFFLIYPCSILNSTI